MTLAFDHKEVQHDGYGTRADGHGHGNPPGLLSQPGHP
ncbi:hypothetical protein GZL_04834 [Streptomyces sp. 769]|nr:hypothetical protein GZL_04834 [Streptomyces sp. 769]